MEEAGIPNPYSRQGEEQPFGYTGYRHDGISGTYFAQAREYQPQNGRFTAEDVIKGNGAFPETLNRYGYCWGNPVGLVDLDGMEPVSDYAGVYYLNSEEGAFGFGHAALLLVREDGSGTFYSYAGSTKDAANIVLGNDVPGYLSKAELAGNDVERFMGSNAESTYTEKEIGYVPRPGNIYTDGFDLDKDYLHHDGDSTPYTRAVYIPITAEEGSAMVEYAESLRKNQIDMLGMTTGEYQIYTSNIYNLYSANCSMIAQDILAAGNKKFALGSDEADSSDEKEAISHLGKYALGGGMVMAWYVKPYIEHDYEDQTIPNGAYDRGLQMIEYYTGWEAGNLKSFAGKKYGGCD